MGDETPNSHLCKTCSLKVRQSLMSDIDPPLIPVPLFSYVDYTCRLLTLRVKILERQSICCSSSTQLDCSMKVTCALSV